MIHQTPISADLRFRLFRGAATVLTFFSGLMVCFVLFSPARAGEAAWSGRNFPAFPSPVNPEAFVVEGTTEIRWMPEAYVYRAGTSTFYIDYDEGDDSADGRSPETAWKHHPWDVNATGNSAGTEGVHTYVFKGGVTYRGALKGRESGTPEEPIRLTRDPSWGEGPATLSGSVLLRDWERVSDEEALAAGIPEVSHGKVWSVTLDGDFAPWAGWIPGADGGRERVPLARWPNWEIEHPYNHFTQWFRVEEADSERGSRWPRTKISAEVLKGFEPDAFDGATIWINHVSPGGNIAIIGPFPGDIHRYNPEEGSLMIPLTHPNRYPQIQSPFFLENLPRFLDIDGEWTFVPDTRKVYLRMPGDRDPNETGFEVARHKVVLDLVDPHHVEVSGLHFTGGNVGNLHRAARGVEERDDLYSRPEGFAQMPAVRLRGDTRNVHLRHLIIHDSAGGGIANFIHAPEDVIDGVTVSDSELFNLDNDGIYFHHHAGPVGFPNGRILNLDILRNRIENIGLRSSSVQGGRGINVNNMEVGEIAGNVIHRVAAMGINVVGARGPLNRILIHGNQVSEGLLHKNDFGNIEFWGHGPVYVYNNVTFDPVGFFANLGAYHKGEAIYFDHGIKGFVFNNIGWSRNWPDARHGVMGQSFFKEVRNRWNQAFHNTAYNFRVMQAMEGVHGDQQHYLSNLFIQRHVSTSFFNHWGLNDAQGIGYARNVLSGPHGAVFSHGRGEQYQRPEDFQAHIETLENHVSTETAAVGSEALPVIDPEARDFRLTDDSAAIDMGSRVFVPWSLYGNVGEWFFRHEPRDPNTVLAYDLLGQSMFPRSAVPEGIPDNELEGEGFTAEDYVPGILEDWNHGALVFDGEKTMRIPQERLVKDMVTERRNRDPLVTDGRERLTVRMTDNNFLVEAVLRTEPGVGGGVIAGKMENGTGYQFGLDESGRLLLRMGVGDGNRSVHTSESAVHDGRWHHVIAEVDRAESTVRFYLNGDEVPVSVEGQAPAPDVSLDNEADFVVGEGFRGALDYLRVSRGTLADARTDIDELMSWQFNGPHLHDFLGRPPTGGVRDAGALEHPTVSGLQDVEPLSYDWGVEDVPWHTRMLGEVWKARMITPLPPANHPQSGHTDPGITGEALAAVRPEVDDAEWDDYAPIPNIMWDGYEGTDGEAVFRQVFEVPEEWAGQDLVLSLGAVDDFDDTFWNGQPVGSTTIDTPGFWQFPRVYTILGEQVEAGPAVIGVRVFDRYGSGGFSAMREEMFIRLKDVETAEGVIQEEDGWLTGAARNVRSFNWGAISVPLQAGAGDRITAQISFGVETLQGTPEPIHLRVKVYADGENLAVDTDPELHRVTPMDPSPYSFGIELPELPGAEEVKAVFHVFPGGSPEQPYMTGEAVIRMEK
ncbi:MAG: right-handed parallel beta-helix repeat-containing protein [Verrucomicrobia bacterium]|nr:right-handed parallel beta-helix repeat-containing protein [Verrucomicrobiota bacterium]MCH8525554.1 right-handed parallel beta-helix repeat-containing protein [Kiritimatiellia bacterium]